MGANTDIDSESEDEFFRKHGKTLMEMVLNIDRVNFFNAGKRESLTVADILPTEDDVDLLSKRLVERTKQLLVQKFDSFKWGSTVYVGTLKKVAKSTYTPLEVLEIDESKTSDNIQILLQFARDRGVSDSIQDQKGTTNHSIGECEDNQAKWNSVGLGGGAGTSGNSRDVQMTGCDREPPGEWPMRPMITFVRCDEGYSCHTINTCVDAAPSGTPGQTVHIPSYFLNKDWPSVHSYLHASHRYVDHLSYEPSAINAQRTLCFRRDMFRRPQAFPGLYPIDQVLYRPGSVLVLL
ncbi:hypothetical protein Bbelb_051780 [Branchiostoma belcheri]|nr:hypothetical protein Bbelb_051780 [Branchiostoma belcheri]